MNLVDVIENARVKASEATNKYLVENGEQPFNCGFAWVVVKGVRGKKADALRSVGFTKRYDGPGLSLWNPSGSLTQDMSAKMAGAREYADTLISAGVDAYAQCRLD